MKPWNIEKEIVIEASPERIFDALTNPEEIVRFWPLDKVESEWTVGGYLRYLGHVDGKAFTDFGIIDTLERPRLFQYTYWSTNHGTERKEENVVTVRYEITSESSGSILKLAQSNLPSQERYELMKNMVLDHLLNCLKNHVEAPAPCSS